MDEPFTGLDPVNLILLREAFAELRDRGRTRHLLDPPDGDGRGDVRIGRHRRPRAARGRWPRPRPQAGQRATDAPDRRRRRRAADVAAGRCRASARRGPTPTGSRSSCCRARIRRPSSLRSSPTARRSAGSRSSSRASRRCSSNTSAARPTTTSTLAPGTSGVRRWHRGRSPDDRPRSAPAERRDRRPARVPRPDPQPAVRRLDDRPGRAGDARRPRPDRHPDRRPPDGDAHRDRLERRGPGEPGGVRRGLGPQRPAVRRHRPELQASVRGRGRDRCRPPPRPA